MDISSLHKYISLSKLTNGSTEVLFSGQPCLVVAENSSGFYWKINPVFAKLVYGANILEDIPYCLNDLENVEEAVAAGLVKLHDLGAFNTEVDLPEDSYAATMDQIEEEVKIHSLKSTDNLTEAAISYSSTMNKLYKEFLSEVVKPLEDHEFHSKSIDELHDLIRESKELVSEGDEEILEIVDAATVILYYKKNTAINEDADEDFENWKKSVHETHPSKKFKFKGMIEQGADTISAVAHDDKRTYGVWDNVKNKGHVFSANESVDEKTLTEPEIAKREEIVKALKKDKKFVSKFGADGLYAVATAKAKEVA